MLGCGENTCHIPLDLFPEFTKLRNPASLCPGHPFAQKLANTLISHFQREPQILFQQISPLQPWIRCREKLQLLLLVFGEILWILEQCVSCGFNIFSKLLFRKYWKWWNGASVHRYTQNCTDLYSVFKRISGESRIELIRNRPGLCDAVVRLAGVPGESKSCLPALRLALLLAETLEQESQLEQQDIIDMSCIGGDPDRISRLDYLINSCFMCELTAEYVAESLFISERQLMRITQKRYGATFRQVVQNKRLDVAAKLLSETDDSINGDQP